MKKNKKEVKAEKELETFMIVNDNDGNDSFEVEAVSPEDAAHKALQELGYWVAKKD